MFADPKPLEGPDGLRLSVPIAGQQDSVGALFTDERLRGQGKKAFVLA